jgi:hypothetical protein
MARPSPFGFAALVGSTGLTGAEFNVHELRNPKRAAAIAQFGFPEIRHEPIPSD